MKNIAILASTLEYNKKVIKLISLLTDKKVHLTGACTPERDGTMQCYYGIDAYGNIFCKYKNYLVKENILTLDQLKLLVKIVINPILI